MKIAVLVKIVPKVDDFKYDYEKNILIRENIKMIINPDDASAIEFALKLKDNNENLSIDVITMAPKTVISILEDILRRNVDRAVLISDKIFQGSDTYSTSIIISRFIKEENYDVILGGTNSLDGDTGHVINQVAEYLDLWSFSNILDFNIEGNLLKFKASIDEEVIECEYICDDNESVILGITKESKKKLRFVRFDNLKMDVSDKLQIIDNKILKIDESIVGLKGSPTKVKNTFVKTYSKVNKEIVENNEEGIQKVYDLLKDKGVIKNV